MHALALVCSGAEGLVTPELVTERDDIETWQVPHRPGKDALAPVLAGLGGRRLVVCGTDADLAAVALRLLRNEALGDVALGYVPAVRSEAAVNWGLPQQPAAALRRALDGEPARVPLVRDDNGGVLVGLGVLAPVRGVVYGDEHRLLRGPASRIEVRPAAGAGLAVRVVRRGLLAGRVRTATARACQFGLEPASPVSDGVRHPRTVTRWTWYRHTEDLQVVC